MTGDYYFQLYRDLLLQKMPSLSAPVMIDMKWQNTSCISCAICLDPMEKTAVLFTSCRHLFHADCIKLWWSQSKSCPFCSKRLDNETLIPATLHQFFSSLNGNPLADLLAATFEKIYKIFYNHFAITLCLIDRVPWICDTLLEHVHFTGECAEILSDASKNFSLLSDHKIYYQPESVWKKNWQHAVQIWQNKV